MRKRGTSFPELLAAHISKSRRHPELIHKCPAHLRSIPANGPEFSAPGPCLVQFDSLLAPEKEQPRKSPAPFRPCHWARWKLFFPGTKPIFGPVVKARRQSSREVRRTVHPRFSRNLAGDDHFFFPLVSQANACAPHENI